MADGADRPLLRQALRGTFFVAALAAAVCAVGLGLAALFVVVMT